MSIKKLEGGQYEVDVWPRGRNGKRIRRRFEKKQEAVLFERYVLANADKKEWLGASVDRRTLSELLPGGCCMDRLRKMARLKNGT